MRELCSFGSGLETVETRADLISRMVTLIVADYLGVITK
jgi:hypothetical protein